MIKLAIYLVFVAIYIKGINGSTSLDSEEENAVNRIVGGFDVDIENYPYISFLRTSNGRKFFACGGSIISRYYLLTAAHCLTGIVFIIVRIGSKYKHSGGTTYNTTTFYSHPFYNVAVEYDYDVGLVYVAEGMDLDGTYARNITMVDVGHDPEEGKRILISGWGRTADNGTGSEELRAATVKVVARDDCAESLAEYYYITSRMFCAGYKEGGVDSCKGDSGGPAVLSSDGKLAGIISFGYNCALPDKPGVYSRIGYMWIRLYISAMTGV